MAQREFYWTGTPKCDMGNGHPLKGVFYDARVPAYRQWGGLCPACADKFQIKLGTGLGQKYVEQPNGKWLKVEG